MEISNPVWTFKFRCDDNRYDFRIIAESRQAAVAQLSAHMRSMLKEMAAKPKREKK